MCPQSWWKMTLQNLLNLWEYVSGQLMKPIYIYIYKFQKVMKPTWFLRLKAIMPRFWINTANQSSAHGFIDFASIRISFGKMIKSISQVNGYA